MLKTRHPVALAVMVLLASAGCGRVPGGDNARLRDFDTSAGALALEGDAASAHVLVHLPQDLSSVALCISDKVSCERPNQALIPLFKTAPAFWRSSVPVNLSHRLEIRVVDLTGATPKVVLGIRVASKSSPSLDLLPPPADLPKMRPIPGVNIAWDFRNTLTRDSETAAVVRMVIQGGSLASAKKVRVTGNLVNLRDSSQVVPLNQEAEVSDGAAVDFTVAGLSADTIYRLEKVTVTDAASNQTAKVQDDFFVATVKGDGLSKAKRRAVLRALAEAYDWDHNTYNSSLGYAAYAGWCDRFYTWVAAYDFKFTNNWGSTYFFRQRGALGDSQRIPEMARTENLMGDLIRYEGTSEGTHTFMIVAYDQNKRSLWTVEGNFNARVMRYQRRVGAPWMHGHLVPEMVK